MKNCIFRLTLARTAIVFMLLTTSLLSRPIHAETSPNLIVGGNGEDGACSDDDAAVTTVPGWTVVKGNPSVLCYKIGKYAVPKDDDAGKAFLAGGPYGESVLKQSIDVSSAQAAIDSGSTTYSLSGLLGGQTGDSSRVTVAASFLDAHMHMLLSPAKLSAVTAAGRRNGDSAFLKRAISGKVPVGTRSIVVSLQFIGTTGHANTGYADNLSLTLSTPMPSPTLGVPVSEVPKFDHVFLVMMENTTYGDVIGDRKNAPFINDLAARGTLLAHSSGTYHPSDENYLAIAGGAAFVKGGVYFPNIRIGARNIADQLEAAGKTWKGYEQGIGIPCGTSTQYDRYFEPDDLPFINFTDIRDNYNRCQAHLVDISELAADLQSASSTPNFAWLAADDYYDGEASYDQGGLAKSLQIQDEWLRQTLTPIFNSPAWKTQRSLLIVTWDESYEPHENHIATILLGSSGLVRAGYVSPIPANHYSIGRTIEEALGIPPMTANDKYARPLNEAFSDSTDEATSSSNPVDKKRTAQ
jgi:Phosphoesterase family